MVVARNEEFMLLKSFKKNDKVPIRCPFMVVICKKKIFELQDGISVMNLGSDLGSKSTIHQLFFFPSKFTILYVVEYEYNREVITTKKVTNVSITPKSSLVSLYNNLSLSVLSMSLPIPRKSLISF